MNSKFLLGVIIVFNLAFLSCASPNGPGDITSPPTSIEQLRTSAQVKQAKEIYQTLLVSPDGGVPEKLLEYAECVAVLPGVLRAAFVAGGRYGKGLVSCLDQTGAWTAPAFIQLSGGSVGLQFGAESTDLVLIFSGRGAVDSLLSSSITLGGDLSVAAGPVGRTAQGRTDFSRTAIYSYARTEGIFAGISLEGAVLRPDFSAINAFYGMPLSMKELLVDSNRTPSLPPEAKDFMALLPTQ